MPVTLHEYGGKPRSQLKLWKVLLLASMGVVICPWHTMPTRAAATSVWITPEEARLPPYQGIPHFKTRGIASGPRIVVLSPTASGEAFVAHRPVKLHVRFETTADAPVDIHSLKVTYLRLFGIDITDRVRPYASDTGIDIDNVEIPPGEHRIELEIGDRQGHTTDEILKLVVM
jgi:hypothetical protein